MIRTAIGGNYGGEKFTKIFEKAENSLTAVDPDDADKRNILLYYINWTERDVDPVVVRHIVTRPTFDINYQNGTYDALSWTAR